MARVRSKNKIPYIVDKIQQLEQQKVRAGVFGPGTLEFAVAAVHEYGTNIAVTPRMRAWFAYQDMPLRAETRYIRIPERSYIRSTFDDSHDDVSYHSKRAIDEMLINGWSPYDVARLVGGLWVDKIRERVSAIGLDSTDYITGRTDEKERLIDSIRYKVE